MRIANFSTPPRIGAVLYRAVSCRSGLHMERATVREVTSSRLTLDLADNSGTEVVPQNYPGLWFDDASKAILSLHTPPRTLPAVDHYKYTGSPSRAARVIPFRRSKVAQ